MANEYTIVADVHEEANTAQEDFDRDSGMTAQVTLRCPFSSRWAVVADMFSNRRTWPKYEGTGSTSGLRRPMSRRWTIKGDDARATPAVSGSQMLYYDTALITVSYDISQGEESEDANGQLFTETLEPNVEFLTLPHEKFRWGSKTGPPILENEAPGKQILSLALTRTTYKVTSIPTAVLTLIGKTNDAPYTSPTLGLTFAAGTLILLPGSITYTVNADLELAFDYTVKFAFKPDKWNYFWRSDTQSYEQMYLSDSDDPYMNYPEASFTPLLSVA